MKVGWYGVFSFFSAQFCWGQNASMQSNSKGMLCGFSARKIKSWKLLSSLFLDPDSRTSSLLQPSQHHYCRIFKMFTNSFSHSSPPPSSPISFPTIKISPPSTTFQWLQPHCIPPQFVTWDSRLGEQEIHANPNQEIFHWDHNVSKPLGSHGKELHLDVHCSFWQR